MTILEQNGRTQEAKREAFMIWDVLGACRFSGPYTGKLCVVRQPGLPLLPFRVKKFLLFRRSNKYDTRSGRKWTGILVEKRS